MNNNTLWNGSHIRFCTLITPYMKNKGIGVTNLWCGMHIRFK